MALDDRIGTIWAPEGKPMGVDWRVKVDQGELIAGLDWIRNVVHHQWADALRLDPVGHGLYPGDDLFPSHELHPKADHAWVWRSVAELPRQGRRARSGRTAFVEHLQGRPAAETLHKGLQSVARVARLLEPRLARQSG